MSGTKNWSVAVAETIMERYPDPDSFPYKSWSYSQGFMLWGVIKLWEYSEDKRYYDYVMKYAESHVDKDGNISGFNGESMDDMMAGIIIVWAYNQTRQDKYKKACENIRMNFDSYPRTSEGAFWHGKNLSYEFWVDGVFMGLIFLSGYGVSFGDSGYCFEEAQRQLKLIYEHCRKGDTGLLYHAWSEDRAAFWCDRISGCSTEVWSEGLGWYALVLAEVLSVMPAPHPGRQQVEAQYKELLQGLKNYQDKKTGLWYQVVDKGDRDDNWHDTSGSAMFLYSIKKAIELGIVGQEDYGNVVESGYKGIISKAILRDSGLVDIIEACDGLCVQKCYSDYVNYEKSINAKEAVAAFLWAATIIEKPGA